MGQWIKNTRSKKAWFVDDDQAKKWLKEDHFEVTTNPSKDQPMDTGTAPIAPPKDGENSSNEETSTKSLKELQAEAKEMGIPNYSSMNKQQLEKAIGDADGAE